MKTKGIGERIEVFESVGSTNDWLLSRAESESIEGWVVAAETQTAGRGRRGRSWTAPAGRCLLFSVGLESDRPLGGLATLCGALSVVQVLESLGLEARLKWPNDMVLEGRKLGGVLCETKTLPGGGGKERLVLGIGLNVNFGRDEIPEELRPIAISLSEALGFPLDRDRLLAEILNGLGRNWSLLKESRDWKLVEAARDVCETLGHHVVARIGDRVVEGLAEDLDDLGRLELRLESGITRVLDMGEIEETRRID